MEDILRHAGIDIAHPKTMAFSEQVRIMARRRTILAMVGSSLHTSIFSAPGRRIIAINLSGQLNSNDTLIDTLNDNTSQYLYPSYAKRVEGGDFHITYYLRDAQAVAKNLISLY